MRECLVSIIIPAFNEAENIEASLKSLQKLRKQGHEIILVDAASIDNTKQVALPLVDKVIESDKGRAVQMHRGTAVAEHEYFWFLHADTRVSPEAIASLLDLLKQGQSWGRFDVQLDGNAWLFRIIERMMNFRSCMTAICTGDQGMFVHRDLYQRVGGFPQIALMEDIALSKRLKKIQRPLCLKSKLITSARRWQTNGVVRTIFLMWTMRLAYFFGVSANTLARWYRHG